MKSIRQRVVQVRKRLGLEIGSKLGELHGPGLSIRLKQQSFNLRALPPAAARSQLAVDLQLVGAALTALRSTPVCFVQVGAYDGRANDPLRALIYRFGWVGVLVEPQASAFERLQAGYSDREGLTFINAAISHEPGEMELWGFAGHEAGDPLRLDQFASLNREHLVKQAGASQALRDRIVANSVHAITLEDAFTRAPAPVDVLQIDAEGYDSEIVAMLDLGRHRPAVIRFEHRWVSAEQQRETAARLVGAGYEIVIGLDDTLAVDSGSLSLAGAQGPRSDSSLPRCY